jgi:alcohol dehydrogenase (cytochrome c)
MRLAALLLALFLTSSTSLATSRIVAKNDAPGRGSGGGSPGATALLNAAGDQNDWILPGKTYQNNRFTGLDQITPRNVNRLAKAWVTNIADDGEQEASPIVWHGTIFIATPHDSVLALNAQTGKLKWQFPYTPRYVLAYAVNRGVGIADGKIFLGTQDCRVIALDANTGHQVWNVNGCPNQPYNNAKNNWFSMAAYVYGGAVILGTAGGDFGNVGHVTAFSTKDGHKLWDWQTLDPKTWPGTSWQHGGGAVWAGLAIDPQSKIVYVAPGNAGPDLTLEGRKGKDLYTDSLVALDVSHTKPAVKWYYQLIQNDTHDADPAMPPVIFDARVGGTTRPLIAIGDKAGNFVVLDRSNGRKVYRLAVDNQTGLFTTVPTRAGTQACPNHGGGIEWNGGSYDPASNRFLIPSTQECATWKLLDPHPKWVPGQPFGGGPLPKRRNGTGELTAIDMATGKVAWNHRFPYPGQGGVLLTKTGVAFTTDLGGHLYAFDAKSGKVLWQTDVGSSNVAPISAYRGTDGNEYIVLLSGEAGNQQTPNIPKTHGSVLSAFRIGPVAKTIVNSAAGQSVAAAPVKNANLPPSIGSAPYTPAQVATGGPLYQQHCANCHGASLQGVSAPALTGGAMANAKLNLSQLRTIVTTQMPLGAPGSLKPDEYAAIIAYLLSYDCVSHSQLGTEAFPTTDRPEFTKVVIGGRSCPAKPGTGGHE